MPSPGLTVEIIGAGMVGSAIGTAMDSWGNDVTFKDIDDDVLDELASQGYNTAAPDMFNSHADLSVVCVPTPFDTDAGQYEHAYVETALEQISNRTYNGEHTVMIHSTVMPGKTEEFAERYGLENVAMVPEVLRENTALNDVFETDKIIVGTNSKRAYSIIRQAYSDKEFRHVTPKEAELIKLTSNNFGSTKISFANEVWRMAEEIGADGDVVLDEFRDICPWIGYPALQGGWPYGGACLPKDSKGTASWADDKDVDVPQLDATIEENRIMLDLDDKKDPQV